jgi:hypothetical protein
LVARESQAQNAASHLEDMASIVPANRRSQDGESETSWRNLLSIRQAVKGPEVHATTPVVHAISVHMD